MSQSSIPNSALTVNTQIFVQGEVVFSRIASHIAGDELKKDKERKMRQGITPIDKPYTTITITNAKIIPATPGNLTLEEQYIQEKLYVSKNTPVTTGTTPIYNYTINSKSPFLTTISQYNDETKYANQIDIKGQELAVGLKVILCLRIFQNKNFTNKGVALDNIIVMEPIRFYQAGGAAATNYSVLGITYQPLPPAEAKEAVNPTHEITANAQPVNYANTTPANNNLYANATPVSNPTGNPYSTFPNNAVPTPVPTQTAPVQSTTPVPTPSASTQPTMAEPESPWICSTCGTTVAAGQQFCGTCGTPKDKTPQQSNPTMDYNPYSAQPTPAPSGILYDPNDTNRNY